MGDMLFYIYENWTAENKAVVHRGSCGHCNSGKGCHDNPLGNKNGKWHGPFEKIEDFEIAAIRINRPMKKHQCI